MDDSQFIDSLESQGIPKRFSKWAISYLKAGQIDPQTIDIKALYDPTLTYQENKNIFKQQHPLSNIEILAKEQASKLQIELAEQQANLQYINDIQQKQAEQLRTITAEATADTDKFFFTAKHFVKAVMQNHANCCILYSPEGGLGKSFLVISSANDEKLELGKDYNLITGYTTPLEFYNKIFEMKDKLIILDDVDGLMNTSKGVSLIKQMTWGTADGGKAGRFLEYRTTSKMRTAPEKYEFTGRIIFCLNHLPLHNPNVQSILSRSLFCHLKFSFATKKQIFMEIAKSPYKELTLEERNHVVARLFEFGDEATIEFNLRTLIKAYDLFIYCAKNTPIWERIIKEMLVKNDEMSIVKQLIMSEKPVSEQYLEFFNQTGLSRATFFRLKKQLSQSLITIQS
jgi:hypothetical protein